MSGEHRTPPNFPWTSNPGTCKWCLEPILPGQRKCPDRSEWHLECMHERFFIFNQPYAKQVMLEAAGYRCQKCGREVVEFKHEARYYGIDQAHLDHIVPLVDWPRLVGPVRWPEDMLVMYAPWLPSNLQILCESCHIVKTSREATRRAA